MHRSVTTTLLLLCWLLLPSIIWAQESKVLLMPTSTYGSDTEQTVGETPIVLYDSGGDNNAVANKAGKIIFTPEHLDQCIEIVIEELALASGDELYILQEDAYFSQWSTPSESDVIAHFDSEDTPALPVTLQADNKAGQLTIASKTKSDPGSGFKILVRAIDQPAISIASIIEDKGSIHHPYIGEQGLIVSNLHISTTGLAQAPTLQSLHYSLVETNPSDLRAIYLYEADSRYPDQLKPDNLLAQTTEITSEGILALSKEYILDATTHDLIVVVDLEEDLSAGSRIDLITTQLTTTLGDHNVSSAESQPLIVEDAYALSTTPRSYTVGEKAIKLYDDGGQYRNISEDFDGYATFKPETAGRVVQVDFSKLDLFALSSIGLADFVEVYNGSEVSPEQLIIRLNKETAYKATSTAPDGSLTIRLVSNTGYPKSGFEALISQVAPQAMQIASLEGHTIEVDTFATAINAGLQRLGLVAFTLTATGTKEPTTLQRIDLSSISHSSDIAQVALYYSPIVDDFDKAQEIARWDFAQTLSATLPTPQQLREGANHFYLAVSLKESAHRGGQLNLSIDKLYTSLGEYELPENERTRTEALEILNRMILTLGNHQVKVYEPWDFQPQLKNEYSSMYDTEAGLRSVTFEATSPNHVIQMDLKEWDFYYSSYGTHPTLQVYDGKDQSAPLLYEMDATKEAFKNKPAAYIRSTQPYLTFVFDAKGGSSSTGWRAEVKEYLPQDMRLETARAKQLELPFVAVGSELNPFINLEIQTIGDGNPLHIDGLKIDLKGCAPQIERVALYATNDEGAIDAERLIAEATIDPTALYVELPADSLQLYGVLQEFANNYILAVDIRQDAVASDAVDIAIAQLSVSGQTTEVSDADPDGSYRLVNILNHPASGEHKEIVVTTPLTYYDEGGADGNTKKNEQGSYVTFLPANPGEVVILSLDSININYNSTFGIYSGHTYVDDSKLLSDGDNNTLKQTGVKTFVSQAEDGSLTVYYKGTNIYNYGWTARVESIKPRQLSIQGASASPLTTDPQGLLSGGAYPALRIALTTVGEQGYTTLDKLQCEISSGSIEELYLYSTGAIAEYDEAHLLATFKPLETQTDVVFKLLPSDTLSMPRTQYYWLKARLAGGLQADTPISIAVKSATIGGEKLEIAQDAPFVTKVRAGGLKGVLRVGSSSEASYKSVVEVAKALASQGVSGAVTVEIEPGEYPETVLLEKIQGVSESNSITFVGVGSSREEVIISATGYSKPSGADAYRKYYGVFTVRNTPHVTLRNLTITSTDLSFPTMVYVQEQSSSFTMDNCYVYTKNTSSSSYNMSPHLVKVEGASNPHAQSCDVTIEGSLLVGGHIGLQLGGTTTVANPVGTGYVVRNNRFEDQSFKAIYVTRASDVVLEGNEVVTQVAPQSSNYQAVDATFHTNARIISNDIDLALPEGVSKELQGIYVREVLGQGLLVANNVVRLKGGSTSSRAFNISNTTDLDLVFNTAIARQGKSAALLMLDGNTVDALISDNILQNMDAGGILFSKGSLPNEEFTFDRNALYTSSETGVLVTADGATYDTTHWQEVTKSIESKVLQVNFASDKVLYPKNADLLPQGKTHPAVTTDILGATRSTESPTIGAYEQDPNVTDQAPKLINKSVVRTQHQSATVSVEPDQMTDIYLMPVAQVEGETTTPEVTEIRDKGVHFTALAQRTTEFTIMGLQPETTYDVYGILHGTLNDMATEPQILYTLTTSYMPTQVATFEKDNRTQRGDTILSGTNSFLGVKVIEDFTRSLNQIAESVGDQVIITVTNAHGKIPQQGFSLMADRTVYMRIDGGTRITIPETEQEWIYVDLVSYGDIRQVTLESRGKLWLDDYNGKALDMSLYISPITISLGEEAQLTAEVRRGVAPYSYEWSHGDHTETVSVAPTQTTRYSVTVTDAMGSQVTESVYVYVNDLYDEAVVATFEEEILSSEQPYSYQHPFGSGSFDFSNSYDPQYNSWSGFALASSVDTTYTGDYLTEQYNNVVGGGQELDGKSDQYAVVYCPGEYPEYGLYNPIVTIMPDNERTVQLDGVYLTNTAWVKNFATQGDKNFGSPAFDEGSFFIVVITADNGHRVEVPLIDYRDKKRLLVDQWIWVDLSTLGEVKALTFSILSSDSSAPNYFAMDNLHIKEATSAQRHHEQIAIDVVETSETTAQLCWQALPTQVSYTISYRTLGAEEVNTMVIDPTQQLRTLELRDGYIYTTLEGLQMGSLYEISVDATIIPSMQVVAKGTTRFTTEALEGKLDAQLVTGSLQPESFALTYATIVQAESYSIEIAQVEPTGTSTVVDVITIAPDAKQLGEASPILSSSTLQDGRITLTLQKLTEQTAYRATITARQGAVALCSEQLIIVTPQQTALPAIDSERIAVVTTPEGILVAGLQGAIVELYTANGTQVGRYTITQPEQLIAERLQSGIYILVARRDDQVDTYRLLL